MCGVDILVGKQHAVGCLLEVVVKLGALLHYGQHVHHLCLADRFRMTLVESQKVFLETENLPYAHRAFAFNIAVEQMLARYLVKQLCLFGRGYAVYETYRPLYRGDAGTVVV